MADIRVTPEVLDSQGKDLISFADQLKEILGAIDTKINEIGAGWDGLAEQAYLDMYDQLNVTLKEFPVIVEDLGKATCGAAEQFSIVDETLQNSFRG